METIILELTLPKTNNKKIVKVDSYPVKLGRGYENDIIIPDDYVSINHLSLGFQDGRLTITDLDSDNGVYLDKVRIISETQVDFEQTFKVGKTNIRVLKPDFSLPATKKLNINKSFIEKYKIVIIAWTSLILSLILEVINDFYHTYEKIEFIKLFEDLPGIVSFLLIFAAVFTLISKLSKKESSFHYQLLLVSLFTIFIDIIINTVVVLHFNAPFKLVQGLTLCLFIFPLACYALIKLFQNSTNISIKNLRIYIITIVYLGYGVISLSSYISSVGYSPKLKYNHELLPKYFKIRKSKSLEEYTNESMELFEKTDISE